MTLALETRRETSVTSIQGIEHQQVVDLYGIIKDVNPLAKNKEGQTGRSITICDDSLLKLNIFLWGRRAETFQMEQGDVVSITNANVEKFRLVYYLNAVVLTNIERDSHSEGRHDINVLPTLRHHPVG
jgi:hypothetical protein